MKVRVHSLESSEKRRNLIIPEEQKCREPSLVQALTGIKSLTQKMKRKPEFFKNA